MYMLIYVAGVVLWVMFGRQERRQMFELGAECRLQDLTPPSPRPRVRTLEAILTALLGAYLVFFGLLLSKALIAIIEDQLTQGGIVGTFSDMIAGCLAGGATMIYLGIKAVVANMRLQRGA